MTGRRREAPRAAGRSRRTRSGDDVEAGEPRQEHQDFGVSVIRTPRPRRVSRVVISRREMLVRIVTADRQFEYELEECSIPVGSYEPDVICDEKSVHFKLDRDLPSLGELFRFGFRVRHGQLDPIELLKDQSRVNLDVVEEFPATAPPDPLPGSSGPVDSPDLVPAGEIRLADRELVPRGSADLQLFRPVDHTVSIWSHTIPLGPVPVLSANASATAHLEGTAAASFGPGMLTDIRFTHYVDPADLTGSARRRYRGTATSHVIGGHARFRMPARARVRIAADGTIKVVVEALGVWDLANAQAGLSAVGEATAEFDIDASAEVLARVISPRQAGTAGPLPPLERVAPSMVRDVDLSTEVSLRGRAGLHFQLDAHAGLTLAGMDVWNQRWKLARFDPQVSWKGGLKYSPNPGVKWDVGSIGVGAAAADPEPSTDPSEFHEGPGELTSNAARSIINAVVDERSSQVTVPQGLRRSDALPLVWRKPVRSDLYPDTVAIPNATEPPFELVRRDGPSMVVYRERGRTVRERLGVKESNWPHVGKTFQFIPAPERVTPEMTRVRRLLERLGTDLGGLDVDHVHEVQFGGADRAANLWPADASMNRSAGTRHREEIDQYRSRLGNINGRYFVIADIAL